MATSFSSAHLARFKREAKKIGRELSITHSEALDRIAGQHGFKNWSLLAKHGESDRTDISAPIRHKPLPSDKEKERHYLHGDQYEDDPARYYCARCDEFVEAGHFESPDLHGGETHGERFLWSLERWNERPMEDWTDWRRPKDAPNLLAARAVVERDAREARRAPFHRWLLTQIDRDDPVGDLAVDARRDKEFPVGAVTRRELQSYLSRHGAHVIRALREAWREFSATQSLAAS
jgi:uncharacterized protein YozE (UPF0346 family)